MLQLVPLNEPVHAVCAELEWERFLVTFKVNFVSTLTSSLLGDTGGCAIYALASFIGKVHLPAALDDKGCFCPV